MSEIARECRETQWTQEEMLWTLAKLAKWHMSLEELATFREKLSETKDLLSPEEKELLVAIIESRLTERARWYYLQHVQTIWDHVASLLESFQNSWMSAVAQAIYQRIKIRFDKTMKVPYQDTVLLELAKLYLKLQWHDITGITTWSEWNIAHLIHTRWWAYSRVANWRRVLSKDEGEGKILFPDDNSLESSAKRLLLYITLSDLEAYRDIFQSYHPWEDLQKLHLATEEDSEISEELKKKYTELHNMALEKFKKQIQNADTLN